MARAMKLAGVLALAILAAGCEEGASSRPGTDSEQARTEAVIEAGAVAPAGMEATMSERGKAITFKGDPLTLVGEELKVGDKAPDFVVMGTDMKPVRLSDFAGRTVVISAVPSVDTPVCATETRTFNEKATSLGDDVVVLTVSMDLPFAQKRFCAAEGIDRVVLASDYKERQFGPKYGVWIKELGLLARCVFVVDSSGEVRYVQLVPEVAQEPDYAAVLEAVGEVEGG